MPLHLFGRARHKVQPNTPNSYQVGDTWGNGAKGFAFVSDQNTFPVNMLTMTGLNFIPLKASPGQQKYQLLALYQGSLPGFGFAGDYPNPLINQSDYPDVEVSGYGS